MSLIYCERQRPLVACISPRECPICGFGSCTQKAPKKGGDFNISDTNTSPHPDTERLSIARRALQLIADFPNPSGDSVITMSMRIKAIMTLDKIGPEPDESSSDPAPQAHEARMSPWRIFLEDCSRRERVALTSAFGFIAFTQTVCIDAIFSDFGTAPFVIFIAINTFISVDLVTAIIKYTELFPDPAPQAQAVGE